MFLITGSQVTTADNRNMTLDIMKGLGIIFMVAAHAACPKWQFIYLFHMALFFLIGGICISEKYSDSLKGMFTFLVKRIKRIYVPYLLMGIIFVLLHNTFLKLNLYTSNSDFLEGDIGNKYGLTQPYIQFLPIILDKTVYFYSEQLLGVCWFLGVTFEGSILYVLCKYICKKILGENHFYGILLVALFCSSIGLANYGKNGPLQIYIVCSIFIFFMLSEWLKSLFGKSISNFKLKQIIDFFAIRKLSILVYLFMCVILCYVMSYLQHRFSIGVSVASNRTPQTALFVLESLLGFGLTYCLSQILKLNQYLAKIVSVIGRYTLSILFLHFVCFKLVILAEILIYKLPQYRLASFPIYVTSDMPNWIWLVYTLVGLILPIICAKLYNLFYHYCAYVVNIFTKRKGLKDVPDNG